MTTTTSISIDPSFCFDPSRNLTADISNKALRKYAEGFESAIKLEGKLPIILDTNILLGYYGMSQIEKQKLLQFLNKYKDRIYITQQVEQEYLRNRLSIIKKDFFEPLNRISEDFAALRTEINGKLQSFRESKKRILSQDYPTLWEDLQKIEEQIKTVLNDEKLPDEITSQVNITTQNNKNIAYIDDLLALVSTLKTTNELYSNEISFIKERFTLLLEDYVNAKDNVKWKHSIPGCGDKKEDPTGDFIIFHEMLKFMKINSTSCIFLTNDVTKGDWLQLDKNPHNHYLEHTFLMTENIIFIVHAEQTLPNISFENIHKNNGFDIEHVLTASTLPRVCESTIITIDHQKGYGFIHSPDENVYFHFLSVFDDVDELKKNDVVSYISNINTEGKPFATNVKKIVYSFDNPFTIIQRGRIAHINHSRGIGFITNHPENLYFHQVFMPNPSDFNTLDIGHEVEFIEGKNYEGKPIARLVRLHGK